MTEVKRGLLTIFMPQDTPMTVREFLQAAEGQAFRAAEYDGRIAGPARQVWVGTLAEAQESESALIRQAAESACKWWKEPEWIHVARFVSTPKEQREADE